MEEFDSKEAELRQSARKSQTDARIGEALATLQNERKARIKEEAQKLDRFLEILCTTDKGHKEAEKEVYAVDSKFYSKPREKKPRKKSRRRVKASVKIIKPESPSPQKEPREQPLIENLYLEKNLSLKQRELLLAKEYKRLKISPFGDSGAAYYWVKTRYNESKEHAFFCYLIEAELKKLGKEPEMNVNNGPDLVFEHEDEMNCIDIETGKNLKKHAEFLQAKFSRYRQDYKTSFIFVTKKEMKYRYSFYGSVVTRSTLREVLSEFKSLPD